MTDKTDIKEDTKEIPLERFPLNLPQIIEEFKKLETRFEKSIEREEDHYAEYKCFEKRTVKFQDEFPYHRMNWLGRFLLWIISKKK